MWPHHALRAPHNQPISGRTSPLLVSRVCALSHHRNQRASFASRMRPPPVASQPWPSDKVVLPWLRSGGVCPHSSDEEQSGDHGSGKPTNRQFPAYLAVESGFRVADRTLVVERRILSGSGVARNLALSNRPACEVTITHIAGSHALVPQSRWKSAGTPFCPRL